MPDTSKDELGELGRILIMFEANSNGAAINLVNTSDSDEEQLKHWSKKKQEAREEARQAVEKIYISRTVVAGKLETLKETISYNQHDMGEVGKFVRVQYAHNFIETLRKQLLEGEK